MFMYTFYINIYISIITNQEEMRLVHTFVDNIHNHRFQIAFLTYKEHTVYNPKTKTIIIFVDNHTIEVKCFL